jgi:Spy/CpxP family protein refolding chaperone
MLATGLAAVGIAGFATGHPSGAPQESIYSQMDLTHLHGILQHVMDNASPEQKARLDALADAATPELQALNEQALAAHRQKVELLLQDNIDPVAVEQARINEQQAADQLSKRIDQALLDLAQTMTPEQRAQLREHVRGHSK